MSSFLDWIDRNTVSEKELAEQLRGIKVAGLDLREFRFYKAAESSATHPAKPAFTMPNNVMWILLECVMFNSNRAVRGQLRLIKGNQISYGGVYEGLAGGVPVSLLNGGQYIVLDENTNLTFWDYATQAGDSLTAYIRYLEVQI